MSDAAFAIRPMQPSDEPFIYRAWLEGYWPHFPGNVVLSKGEFMQRWHRVIERILADAKTRTVVAHVEGEPDALLGFACGSDACLHWAYVKQAFRRMGISRNMIGGFRLEHFRCSHYSDKLPIFEGWEDVEGEYWWTYAPELLKEYTL